MNDFSELQPAAAAMLRVNLALRDGEKVAFVTDVPTAADWERLPWRTLVEVGERAFMARRVWEMVQPGFPANRIELICYPLTGQHGREPDAATADRLLGWDVLVMMNTYSLSHTEAREKASKQGARIASMPGVEAAMFAPGGPMAADYKAISAETERMAALLTAAKQARVTTPFGTDLTFSLEGRKGGPDTGLIHKPGEFGNLPGGEAYAAPVEGTAEGRLVVPAGWYPGLDAALTFTFAGGLVTAIEGGGAVGDHFRSLLVFDDPALAHRRNCAELGIGTNPNAKRPDNVLEAEKILGTVHIAIGDSSHLGGVTPSDLHEDFVLTRPTLALDGVKVIG